MLEGRRWLGRNAGLTSSPDFLRTIWGFLIRSSSVSSSDAVNELSADLRIDALGSVAERTCELLRPLARSIRALVLKLK